MTKLDQKRKWTKTLQFFAAYLVAAWTFLQFVDWILNRYEISPNWVDFLLWFFIGIIPSLIIYLYNQERINSGIIKLWEKIIIPLNFVLLGVVLYFGFGNSDLGATTKEISYTNDEGGLETQVITKEEFRIGLPIFEFEQEVQDTSYTWLEDGIQELLYQDLLQDKHISPYESDSEGTVNKVAESRIFNEFYLDGTYKVVDSVYTIKPTLRNAKNGKVIKEQVFKGDNLLSLLDDITVFVKNNVGLLETQRDFYIDLNLSEFYSNSLEAIKYNLDGNYKKAQELDSTFSISYFENAFRFIRYSFGSESEKNVIDKAYRYSNKLPLQMQLQIRILRHIAYEEWDIAEKLLKLQLEIDPSNETYNRLLYAVYGETKQTEAFLKHAEERYEKNKSIDNGTYLLHASLVAGRYDDVIRAIRALELVQPNNPDLFSYKIRPQLLKGNIEAARKTQERVKLMHPEWENFSKIFDTIINYLSKTEISKIKNQQFVGKYRHQATEQTYEHWIENNRLVTYVSNQRLYAPIPAGDDALVIGGYINRSLTHIRFLKDSTGTIYGTKNTNYNFNDPASFYYWTYDESITTAERSLMDGKLEEAEVLYKKAIARHPKHYFLKLALQHIEYLNSITTEELKNQLNTITGTYGPRKFWVKDGKLMYQRGGNPKLHLLPISKERYIALPRYGTQYAFEQDESGRLASVVYAYNNELNRWDKLLEQENYLLKDEDY
ncbi:hypothetical protein J4050_11770 [Winogradskyella sp. DF17]|uniref:Tetratricopeptide repeat protein n=1 Tax=Winogradskyella pelagia TaxID=2819984 RepID=A0ABS3T6T7_9FLAO|nr:hypothetical protein [Winogradskyella sp. DF17]MBO3117430.1 hypothetical protein [Winogradskyella sp. DF17]